MTNQTKKIPKLPAQQLAILGECRHTHASIPRSRPESTRCTRFALSRFLSEQHTANLTTPTMVPTRLLVWPLPRHRGSINSVMAALPSLSPSGTAPTPC